MGLEKLRLFYQLRSLLYNKTTFDYTKITTISKATKFILYLKNVFEFIYDFTFK